MKIKFKHISMYRVELMGIAIILIMLCHNTMKLNGLLHSANSAVRMLSQVGVDMFFFFSGFGCFYSMRKNADILGFYKRRLIKILPPYLIVILLFGLYSVLIQGTSLSEYLWNYSLISFFTEVDLHEWFIASILVIYLIYPFIHGLLIKSRKGYILMIAALYLFLVLFAFRVIHIPKTFSTIVGIFFTRIPAFLLGTLFAEKSMGDDTVDSRFVILSIVLNIFTSGISLYLFHIEYPHAWTIIRMLFIVTVFAIMMIWIAIRESAVGKSKFLEVLARFMRFTGVITLEIYLVHEKLLSIISSFMYNYEHKMIVSNIIAVLISLPVAYYLQKLCTCRKR